MILWKSYLKLFTLKTMNFLIYFSGIYSFLNKIVKDNGVYILMYHRIGDTNDKYYYQNISVKKEELIKQIRFFKRNYRCISLPDAISMLEGKDRLEDNYVVFTFDDGYIDNVIYGKPIFKEFDIYPTIYLTAANLDKGEPLWTEILDEIVANCPNLSKCKEVFNISIPTKTLQKHEIYYFSEKLKTIFKETPQKNIMKSIEEIEAKFKYTHFIKSELMDWEGVISLANSGWTIGSHTMNHINIAIESKELVTKELHDSLALIESKIESSVYHFSYPFGKKQHFNEYAIEVVKKYYSSAVTAMDGINKCGDDLFRLKRVMIANHYSLIDIKVKLLRIKLKDFLSGKKSSDVCTTL